VFESEAFGGEPVVDDRWDDPAYLAELDDEWQGHLAGLSPQDRFEEEYGRPWHEAPEPLRAGTSQEAASAQQDLFLQSDAVLRKAEATQVHSLLLAYESSMTDLAARYGPEYGCRTGRGASTFFASIAERTQRNPLHVAHLVDTAMLARDRLPRTWAVLLAGGTSWRRVAVAVKQADGLDPERWAAYDEVAAVAVVASTRLKHELRTTRERLQDGTADERRGPRSSAGPCTSIPARTARRPGR
jgi:hypothetical protein